MIIKPIPTDISDFLSYDETSPSCLRWIKVVTKNQRKPGDNAGALNKHGYHTICFKQQRLLAHRIVYFIHYGTCPKVLDHIDGNRSNNKISNLRAASYSQNNYNRKKDKNTSNIDKGITTWIWSSSKRNKTYEYWRVRVCVGKKEISKLFLKSKYSYEFCKQYCINLRNNVHREFANHGF